MIKKLYFLFATFAFVCQAGFAQNFQRTNTGVKTSINGVTTEVQFFTPSIVRVLKYPDATTPDKKSLSVILSPEKDIVNTFQDDKTLSVKSNLMQVKINRQTGQINFYNEKGMPLLNEKETGIQFTPAKDGDENTYRVSQSFQLQADEAIYGLGQHQKGLMNQRNQKLVLSQSNMQIAIPFF